MDQPAETNIICRKCGYDLRGTPGNICSECGTEFDRNEQHSLLPWENPNSGWFRLLRTVWRVLIGRQVLSEAERTHVLSRAYWFRRVVFCCYVLSLVLPYLALLLFLKRNLTSIGQELMAIAGKELFAYPVIGANPLCDFYVLYGMGLYNLLGWFLPLVVLPMLARDWVWGIGDALKMKTDSPGPLSSRKHWDVTFHRT